VAPARISEALLQSAPVGEQQQPLAVGIETPDGVDPRLVDEGGKGEPAAAGFQRELAEDPKGFVEKQRGQGRSGSGALTRPPEVDHAD
jgi:hypothetical protein